jgi:hypothetical protein
MSPASPAPREAFHRLERDLRRRRFEAVDPLLRVEVAALAVLGAGFVFWQARIPLHAQVRDAGPIAFVVAAAACWAFLAVVAALLAGGRMAAALRTTPAGPAWLHLPVAPDRIEAHLSWNAIGQTIPLAIAGGGLLAAGIGIVPAWWIPFVGAAGGLLIYGGARAGCWIAVRAVAPPGDAAAPIERALAARRDRHAGGRLPAPRWRRTAPWRALLHKDLRWLLRPSRARRVLPAALGLAVLSVIAWRLPVDMHAARFAAFALALLAAASLAEWLVELTTSDPFPILRSLPVGLADVWRARAFWVALFALALVVAHALAGAGNAAAANPVFLIWLLLAMLCIGLLGVHYGITLFPQGDIATRLLGLSLGLAVAVSIMLPMAGWLVLLTALLHSTRRLSRWWRIEDL